MATVSTIKINSNTHFPFEWENYHNRCFNINHKNFKTPIEKTLKLKESIFNVNSVYSKVSTHTRLDIVEIPERVKQIAKQNLGIDIVDFKPWVCLTQINIESNLKHLINQVSLPIEKLAMLLCANESKIKLFDYLKQYTEGEIAHVLGLVRKSKKNFDESICDFFEEEEVNKPVLVYGKDIRQTLVISKNISILFGPNYLISTCSATDVTVILSGCNLLIISTYGYAHSKLVITNDKLSINTFIKSDKATQIQSGKITPDNTIEVSYKYKDNIKTNMFMFHKKYLNGDEYDIYNKNGLIVQTRYNWAKKYSHIISQCTTTDEKTGLRFRGKVEIENKESKPVSKKLSVNGETQYEKSGDQVLVDKLSNLRLSNEPIIGWKAVKNANGEKRVLKLAIPPDAQTVIPIDEEYYLNNQKERADQAIVMDIQMPDEQDEISVVPHEMVAYSYVYSNGPRFEYKIGQLVKPDGFNPNPDVGCANGIHFFRSKANLFKSYINV